MQHMIFVFIFTCLCIFLFMFVTPIYSINMTVAVLAEEPESDVLPFPYNRTSGIIDIAIAKSRAILADVAHLDFVVVPVKVPHCTALKWGATFSEVYHQYKPDLVIGPACSPSVAAVSRMTVAWSIPHITYVGTSKSLADKTEFSTLTRLSYTLDVFAKFYVYVFDAFGWTNVANIYDSVNYLPNLVGTNFQRTFDTSAPHIKSHPIPFDRTSPNLESELIRVLQEAAKISRVFMVCCHGDVFRQMVLLAQRLDFLEEGKYLFIFHFQVRGDPQIGKYDWRRGDELDQEARKAYESVMVIRPRRPVTQEYFEYENEVRRRAEDNFGYTWEEDDEVNIFEIGLFDAFILHAHVVNETIYAGEDPTNSENIMTRLWNRTFPGIGGQVYINSNGDRDTDFTLLDLNPNTGEFQAVAQYLGWKSQFEFIDNISIHWPNNAGPPPNVPECGFTGELCISFFAKYLGWKSQYDFIDNVSIHWPNNAGPPPNVPECGFTGELCISFSLPNYVIVAISLSAVILVVILAGLFAYRRVRSESALYSEWWKVKWEDISMRTASTAASFYSQKGQIRTHGDDRSLASRKAFLQNVGVYKGSQIYIKKLTMKSLTMDRALLLELKQIHELTCQNLTRLIGVCPETSNVCILSEYCSRGNLQDILHNESMQLDRAFKISLVNDIVEGMHYLHSSSIGVHGRLTSSRCVIDSRFVLKITGFALKSVIAEEEKKKNALRPELLWKAPEHLRLNPTRNCSQAGDVYSFGIILYEMITRSEPYVTENWYINLKDTLARIKMGGPLPTRPSLEKDEIHDDLVRLAKNCWVEDPLGRPTFANVRRELKHLGHSKGGREVQNVLDILLNRMEQYANNLEGLVEERTQQFLDEKKRSEELLHQVLPKSVAEQLLAGDPVHPESFDSVTVYFSDIVGFTNIAAKSSPFQIVDFLNDLYTCFDAIIDNFDVYKVETIGDAYMVVSGLPERNGVEHVVQIARMSLAILDNVRDFTIRHQPFTQLKARIGLHSGSVCAGVVGRKMPRYCLFGDTVNTASRMESTGEAMRIQISQDTKDLLEAAGNFLTEERGTVEVKGKGLMTTFWLIEETSRLSVA